MPLTPEQLEKIRQDAKNRKAQAAETRVKAPFNIVFVPDATIYIRCLTDSAGAYVRTFLRHKTNRPDNINFQCLGREKCSACARLDDLPDWSNKWRFRSREVTILYAWIEKYEGPESQYVRIKEHVLLMGGYKLANALSEFITDLDDPEELGRFLNPEFSYPLMKVHSNLRGREFQMGVAMTKRIAIPPLPATFPPLSECIYGSQYTPDARSIDRFIAAMEMSLEGRADQSISSTPVDDLPWEDNDNANGASTSNGNPSENAPENCPTCYGNKPEKPRPACLLCTIDEECAAATHPNNNAN